MASLLRLILIFLNIISIPIYLIFIISEGLLFQIAGAITILLLLSLLLFTGNKVSKKSLIQNQISSEPIIVGEVELPAIVTSEIIDTPEPNQKITRSRGRTEITNLPPIQLDDKAEVDLKMEYEEGSKFQGDEEGLAKLYVATSDPDSQHELEVEQYITAKRDMRNQVKDRLTKERRMALAKNISKKVSEWTDSEDGEDFTKIINNKNSEIQILTEPEEYNLNIPQGISYVRVDANRILKIRVSLNVNNNLFPKITDNNQIPDPVSLGPNSQFLENTLPPPIDLNDNQSLDTDPS